MTDSSDNITDDTARRILDAMRESLGAAGFRSLMSAIMMDMYTDAQITYPDGIPAWRKTLLAERVERTEKRRTTREPRTRRGSGNPANRPTPDSNRGCIPPPE